MRARLSAIALASLLASACATSSELEMTEQEEAVAEALESRSIAPATADERAAIENQDLLTQAAFWAEAYELNPADREAAYKLSTVLRRLNGAPRAAQVARQALALYPDDVELQTAFGLALTAAGQGAQAVEPLSRAHQAAPDDWRILNALGVALDQSGRADRARGRFEQALLASGGEPSVLNNLALSVMLDGDPERAESLLRRAADDETSGPEVRQNLALALALQGRFDEAESIALVDSTPEMARQNLDYVRALMSSGRTYDRLREADLRGMR
ncbi:MAG: tetratricopeptide repeat protein [Alphaproteobacteria bacterium]|nr:tetratricopeptide repeat protein [Alphaproteobacteria bacterium]